MLRPATGDNLLFAFRRCHNYIAGNQGLQKPEAFWELLKLIFCKIYDERLLRADSGAIRRFWVGVTERNHPEGQREIAGAHQTALSRQLQEMADELDSRADELERANPSTD